MKFLCVILFLICFLGVNVVSSEELFEVKVVKEWTKFLRKFGKNYVEKTPEYISRFAIFQKNLRKIIEHNKHYEQNLTSYKMGINYFVDHTAEEFLKILKASWKPQNLQDFKPNLFKPTAKNLPVKIDWRWYGAVTRVKNQGNCGSCWSFTTVGALESHYYLKTRRLVDLSTQQLIDCSNQNAGCNGGGILEAFNYLARNGIQREFHYPYKGYNDKCTYNPYRAVVKMKGYVQIEQGNEYDLQYAVGAIGPVAVGVDATNWAFYHSGIFDDHSCSSSVLNHAVVAVGYGTENGQDYWILKNSWGWDYGENGYIRMIRNRNLCGIAMDASYPVV